jgi:hypothetical protein
MTTTLVRKNDRHATRLAGEAMRNREPFRNSNGSLRGEPMQRQAGSLIHSGRMPETHARDLAASVAVDYVVWSYATPIAWHSRDGWHVPATSYSVTTSQHQGTVRVAVHYSGERMADDE